MTPRPNQTLIRLIEDDARNRMVSLLVSYPGSGLLAWTRLMAETRHTASFLLNCDRLLCASEVSMESAPGSGTPADTVRYHDVIRNAARYAETHPDECPVLIFDNVDKAMDDVTLHCLGIAANRSVRGIPLPENLQVIFTSYSPIDTAGLDDACAARCRVYPVGGSYLPLYED